MVWLALESVTFCCAVVFDLFVLLKQDAFSDDFIDQSDVLVKCHLRNAQRFCKDVGFSSAALFYVIYDALPTSYHVLNSHFLSIWRFF